MTANAGEWNTDAATRPGSTESGEGQPSLLHECLALYAPAFVDAAHVGGGGDRDVLHSTPCTSSADELAVHVLFDEG